MSNDLSPEPPLAALAPSHEQSADAEAGLNRLGGLIDQLDRDAGGSPRPAVDFDPAVGNQLAEVRLGVASSLYRALRCKHEPTAKHCLRVTLACASWASRLGLSDRQRDELEVAALLHDIGKIGVPDTIITKPDPLTPPEAAVMDAHWLMGEEILRSTTSSPGMLAIVVSGSAWYDGSRSRNELTGDKLPLGARMLAIVDAFDAMMSDHVYRRAFTQERAFNELYRCAGAQFDPRLVQLFTELHECDQSKLRETAAQGWLRSLESEAPSAMWRLNDSAAPAPQSLENLFQQKLLANMFDAVVFVDSKLRVVQWNRGAERLTGISESSVYQRRWLPSLIQLSDEHGEPIRDEDCPVTYAIRTGVQWLRRLTIRGRNGRPTAVDAHAIPVSGADGIARGLALVLHDASPETSLEARCENLKEKAARDPFTQLANRAEFDRTHAKFVRSHLERSLPYSLVIADIDRFKFINDTYGHQAGDEVIQALARLLKDACGPGDLAARYGGEEFVLLYTDCDNSKAVRRAEELRSVFAQLSHAMVDGKPVTASFGVTEIQPGDTPETMLRRADRALLLAKQNGRNRVVQLGMGSEPHDSPGEDQRLPRSRPAGVLIERVLVSEAPLAVCAEKLRGFVADHHAEVLSAEEDQIRILVCDAGYSLLRRVADRPVRLLMDLKFEEIRREQLDRSELSAGALKLGAARTRIRLTITSQRKRDRRKDQLAERARQLLISFRAYLMASECESPADSGVLRRARGLFGSWFGKS
ncbi:MAG TPA: diguanylate cyclase [Pirellulales bacterium]|nr:diguanylate cyclase [Pirellulales bacterium]